MTNRDTEVADLQSRVAALEQDRDYWRDQHDLVMQDWRADIEAWTISHADVAATQDVYRAALADLLRFFDPSTGAVATRLGRDFLGDAFAKAHRLCTTAPPTAGAPPP